MRVAKSIAAGLAAFCAIYLAGAFVAADFNIANWVAEGRFVVAVFGATLAGAAFIAVWEQSHA